MPWAKHVLLSMTSHTHLEQRWPNFYSVVISGVPQSERSLLGQDTPVLGGLSLVSKLLALGHLASALTVTWHPLDLGLTSPNSTQQQRHFSDTQRMLVGHIDFLVQVLMDTAMIIEKESSR